MFLAIRTKRKTRWTYAETNSDFNIWSLSDTTVNSKSKTNTDVMKTYDWSHVTHWRSAHYTQRERQERRARWIFRFVDSCPSLSICREGLGICLRHSGSSWDFQFCHPTRCSADFPTPSCWPLLFIPRNAHGFLNKFFKFLIRHQVWKFSMMQELNDHVSLRSMMVSTIRIHLAVELIPFL